ncbi:MAG: hypothetical protein ABR527_00785 [Gemmatimonadota bacterium]
MSRAGCLVSRAVFVLAVIVPCPAVAQEPAVSEGLVVADTVWIEGDAVVAGVPSVAYERFLVEGERLAVWVENEVEVGRPGLEGRPVPDATLGSVVARFEGSGVFAWPERPFVWTAPGSGLLVFGVNAYGAHEPRGGARVVVVPLGPVGTDAPGAFPPPLIELERVPQGVVARYADRPGFGVVPSTLSLTITTSRGVEYRIAPWVNTGSRDTFLPLPPPDIPLSPGVHALSATVQDWLGNAAPPAHLTFDTP